MKEYNLDLDTFGKMMEGFLLENKVQMLITMEEDTMDPDIQDNIHLGPVVHFYIMLHSLEKIVQTLVERVIEPSKAEELIDTLLDLVKEDIMENLKEAADADNE